MDGSECEYTDSKMVENGESKVLKKYAYYMRQVYAWPNDGETVTWKLCLICWTRAIFGGIIMYTGAILYLHKAKEGDPTNERIIIVWNILEVSVVIVETVALNFVRGNAFIAFLKKVNQYPFGKPDNIEKIDKKQERTLNIWYYTIKAGCFVYILHNYIRNANCDLRGITGDKRFICGLLLPTWFPMELDYFPFKQLLLLNNVMSMWIFVPALGVGPPMVIASVELIIVRMKFLRKHIKKLKFGHKSDTDVVKKQLLWCIRYHEHIMELIEDMYGTVGYYFAPQYFVYTALLAVLVHKMTMETNLWNVFHLTLWMLHEFQMCFYGQYLENEALSLNNCLYDRQWYDMTPESRKIFMLFLSKLQKPVQLKAHPILVMNSEYLLKVLKAAFSFSTYLRSFSSQ